MGKPPRSKKSSDAHLCKNAMLDKYNKMYGPLVRNSTANANHIDIHPLIKAITSQRMMKSGKAVWTIKTLRHILGFIKRRETIADFEACEKSQRAPLKYIFFCQNFYHLERDEDKRQADRDRLTSLDGIILTSIPGSQLDKHISEVIARC